MISPVENERVAVVDAPTGVYALALTPNPSSSLKLYVEGVRQTIGTHFILVGNLVTFIAGFIPPAGALILADYSY